MYNQVTMFEIRRYPNPYAYSCLVGGKDHLIASREQARKIVRRLRASGVVAFCLPVTVNVLRAEYRDGPTKWDEIEGRIIGAPFVVSYQQVQVI